MILRVVPLSILCVGIGLCNPMAATAEAPAAPKLVDSSPKPWQVSVNVREKHVSITFSQPMHPAYSAWLGRSSLQPPEVDINQTINADHRTLSIKVGLESGKVYVFALNEANVDGVGFLNEQGRSAAPFYLVFQTAGNASKEDSPPRAISTLPGNAGQDVNPATTRGITVVFDRAMDAKKHGFHLFEEKKPVDLNKVPFTYSADGKTFNLNYPLKPSTHYEVQMNSTEDIGFAATNRVPLWPVHFAFTTGQPH